MAWPAGRLGAAMPRWPAVRQAPGESGRGSSHTRGPPGMGLLPWAGPELGRLTEDSWLAPWPPVSPGRSGCSGLPAGHALKSHVAGFAPWQGLALGAHRGRASVHLGLQRDGPPVRLRDPQEEASVRLVRLLQSAQGIRQRWPPADPPCPVPMSGGSGRGQAGLWGELASGPDSDGWAGTLGPAAGEVSLLPSGHEASWAQPHARGTGLRAASGQVASVPNRAFPWLRPRVALWL